MMIDKRIEHYQKENARLFELINSTQTKSNKDSIIKTINEHEAVIRELKHIKKLNLGGVRLSLNEDIYECLRELCKLKCYKDEQGKDGFYKRKQPELWEQANKLINKYNEA